jgi:hypothetical protein
MNALSLEKNGRVLSSKCTKHIKAKYFLIKDYYDSREINLKFCLTDKMWADALTKPLQGQKFRDMQAFLQNCNKDYNDDIKMKELMKPQSVASLQDCVGKNTKSLLNSQPVSPTCVSQITTGRKPKVTWRKNKIWTFPVNSNFLVRLTWELTHGNIKSLMPPPSLTVSLSRAKGRPRLGEDWRGSKINSHNLDAILEPNVLVQLCHE